MHVQNDGLNSVNVREQILAVALCILAATQLTAQRDTTTPVYVADSLVVTAEREAPSTWGQRSILATTVAARSATQLAIGTLGANTVTNNARELFARAAGIHVWEFSGTGIQTNVSTRGLSAHRSSEFNVRMDGYDIASDPYGYPESHFTPPAEVMSRIDVIRGGGGIQYGPQYGGMLNYVSAAPSEEPLDGLVRMTGGMYGLFDGVALVSGTIDDIQYRAWGQYRRADAWRANGSYELASGHALVGIPLSTVSTLRIALTGTWFLEHMPNGLTDAQFASDWQQSVRPRDYFSAPRVMPAVQFETRLSSSVILHAQIASLFGARNSISLTTAPWIADTLTNPRRVNGDDFANVISEVRLRWDTSLGDLPMALTGGVRGAWTTTDRRQGRGVDGSEYDMAIIGDPTLDLLFTTTDVSLFSEGVVQIIRDLTVTAGIRVQALTSSADGTYAPAYGASQPLAFQPSSAPTSINDRTTEIIPLGSLGVSYRRIENIEVFANIAQAYRPLFYAQRYPYDFIPVDSSIRSSHGIVSELGIRCSTPSWLRSELTGFWIVYGDRTAVVHVNDSLYPNGLRTNAGTSVHRGVEANVQALIPSWVGMEWQPFVTLTYTDARYTQGPADGKRVENAPEWILRGGVSVSVGDVRCSATMSYVSAAFSDASNTAYRADGTVGVIPAYALLDASVQWTLAPWCSLTFTANNILNRRYFTTRATTYPGPGLLPGEGTVASAGVSVRF